VTPKLSDYAPDEIIPVDVVRRLFDAAGIFQYQTHDTARAFDGGSPNYPNTAKRIAEIIASAIRDAEANRERNENRIPTTGLRQTRDPKTENEFGDTF